MNFRINLYPNDGTLELCFNDVFFAIDGGLNADGKFASLSVWDHPISELDAALRAIPDGSFDMPANYGFVDLCDFWMLQDAFSIEGDLLERVEQAASATPNAMQYSKVVYVVLRKLLQNSRDRNHEEAEELQEAWLDKLAELLAQPHEYFNDEE